MHSSFRISNSSDSLPLRVGAPSIQKLHTDKRSEELKIYVELGLEATKLSASTDDQDAVTENTDTLLVEPHSFTVVATPLTRELLIAEERARAREAARLERELETFDSNESDSEPLATQVERRKSSAVRSKPNSRELSKAKVEVKTDTKQIFRKSQNERERALAAVAAGQNIANVHQELPDKKPPDISLPPKPSFTSPLHLPNLPTTPIPVSELPPTSVRSPPLKSPPINPLLQNLTPIPPRQHVYTSRPPPNILPPLSHPKPAAPATPSPARPASSDLISIQVPMAGPDGSQTLQTINVPRSVLAGASDRPILLTVTPKNGINKGQKQIVVLTKNTSGSVATSRTATISTTNMTLNQKNAAAVSAAVPPASPCKSVQLSPRVLGGVQTVQANTKPAQLSQTSVNALLAASKPVGGTITSTNPMVVTSQPAQTQQVLTPGQLGVRPGPQPVTRVVQQVARPVQTQLGQVVRPPLGQVGRTVASSQAGQSLKPGQTSQVIRGHLVQTSQGQVLVQGNRQILLGSNVIQNGKLVLNQAQLQALTGQLQTQTVSSGQAVTQTVGNGQQQHASGGVMQSRVVSGGQALNQGLSGGQIQTRVVSGGGQLQSQVISGGQLRTQVITGGQLQSPGLPVRSVMSVSQLQSKVSSSQLQTVLAGGQLQTVVSSGQMQNDAHSQTSSGPHIVSGRANPGQIGQVISQGGIQKVLTMGAGGGGQYVRVLAGGSGAGFVAASPNPGGQIGNNSTQFISSPANTPAQGTVLPNGSSVVPTPSGGAVGDTANNSLSRILTALHNRGLVSQQNGKFYYVGDKSKSPVSLSPGAAFKLAASTGVTTSPVKASLPNSVSHSFSLGGAQDNSNGPISGITSLTSLTNSRAVSRLATPGLSSTQQSQANQNTIVVAAANNLDSYTADPSMLQMANSLLQQRTALNPDTSFASNATNNSALLHSQSPSHHLSPSHMPPPTAASNHSNLTNGLAEVSPLKTTSQGEINNQTFYYRDLALPLGWYVRIDKRLIADYSYEVDTSFFSPDGALLKSQAEISAYLTGQLVVEDLSHRAPVSVNLLPWKEDLNEINKQFVPNIDIAGAGGFSLNDATSQSSLKRSLASQDFGVPVQGGEKKSKSENFLFL